MTQQPYTHAAHAQRCHKAALEGLVISGQLVQVKKRNITYCAKIKSPWTIPVDNIDCWTVETTWPEKLSFIALCKNVRLCGDENCACKAEEDAMRERFSAALAASRQPAESK